MQSQPNHEDEAEPKAGNRLSDHGKYRHPAVDPGILLDRRQHAERDRYQERQPKATKSKTDGDRQTLGDQVRDRFLEKKALAKIADERPIDPAQELHEERTVETIGLANDLNVRLRRIGARYGDGEITRQSRQHECKRCDRDRNHTSDYAAAH